MYLSKRLHFLLIAGILISISSCVQYRDLLTFRDGQSKTLSEQDAQNITYEPIKIQKNDILAISVNSQDPKLIAPFMVNAQFMNAAGNPSSPFSSYLVSLDGDIAFPVIGKMQAEGRTIRKLQEEITDKIRELVLDATVNVRLVNFKISIIGEVKRPTVFEVSSERVTILEALSAAGDMTPYANRKEVYVIREQDGERIFGKIDMQSHDIFTSPYYFLRQNDIVYVEPSKKKVGAVRDPLIEIASLSGTGISLLLLILRFTN